MQEGLCFNRTYFIMISVVILIILISQFINLRKKHACPVTKPPLLSCPTTKCPTCPSCPNQTRENSQVIPQLTTPISQQSSLFSTMPPAIRQVENFADGYPSHPTAFGGYGTGPNPDIIRQYDYSKTFDPLEEPARRVSRYEIPPYHMKRMIDIPSRGYPDNFTQFGILIKQGDPDTNSDNRILRLFGRQEFPGSYRYEYYTMLSSGNDQVKIPLDTRAKKELYDGDVIVLDELGEEYRVQLHKFDAPKYYPDLMY